MTYDILIAFKASQSPLESDWWDAIRPLLQWAQVSVRPTWIHQQKKKIDTCSLADSHRRQPHDESWWVMMRLVCWPRWAPGSAGSAVRQVWHETLWNITKHKKLSIDPCRGIGVGWSPRDSLYLRQARGVESHIFISNTNARSRMISRRGDACLYLCVCNDVHEHTWGQSLSVYVIYMIIYVDGVLYCI